MKNNFRWPENPLLKFEKWFTLNFFVKHFPKTYASPPAPSALSFAQHCKIFFIAFSGMQPNTKKIYIYFPWNHFHLKIFCNEKYFITKQAKPYAKVRTSRRLGRWWLITFSKYCPKTWWVTWAINMWTWASWKPGAAHKITV